MTMTKEEIREIVRQSFDIVKNRLQELGLELEYIPGERGGLTTGWRKVKQ